MDPYSDIIQGLLRTDKTVKVIATLSGDLIPSKINIKDFPTRIAFRKALIKERKENYQKVFGDSYKFLQQVEGINVWIHGRIVIIQGPGRLVANVLSLPIITAASKGRKLIAWGELQ